MRQNALDVQRRNRGMLDRDSGDPKDIGIERFAFRRAEVRCAVCSIQVVMAARLCGPFGDLRIG